eukprot:CAMPEP_0201540904 /NCGR_PEP_ID=MMETSP0161_2-20130828/71191_1 /ASSEMBLY_ACC=CAM_ASM_000251 /TAXON_ID=180227 /ORGANISM="Neoparamoeba aestuarina, Strain SoJaBio B1-5/56/2" /LENGTH=490 /DNA_ID=CAMNT_0047948405 /DNA_START=197 /DNA_END=1671 /DNA_ORIENTATION=+
MDQAPEAGQAEESRRKKSARSVVLTKAKRADRDKAALSALHYKQIQGEEPPFFLDLDADDFLALKDPRAITEKQTQENTPKEEKKEKKEEEKKEEKKEEEKKGDLGAGLKCWEVIEKNEEKKEKDEQKDEKKGGDSGTDTDDIYDEDEDEDEKDKDEKDDKEKGKEKDEENKGNKKQKKETEDYESFYLQRSFNSIHSHEGSGVLCIIQTKDVHWVSFSNGRISIFDNLEYKEVFTLSAPLKERAYVLLVEDGYVYMISEQGKVAVWTEDERKLEGFFRTSHSHIVKSALFLNGRLWTADVGGVVLVWEAPSIQLCVNYSLPGPIVCMCPVEDHMWFGGDGHVYIMDLNVDEVISFPAHSRFKINSLVYLPTRKEVWSGSDDTTIQVWSSTLKQPLMLLSTYDEPIYCMSPTTDERFVFIGGFGMDVWVYDTKTHQPLRFLKKHQDAVRFLSHSSDNSIISGARDGLMCVWKPDTRARGSGGWIKGIKKT